MRLYDKNGYINQEEILETPDVFIFEIGPRGTGKSYGILKYILEQDFKFILLRRSQTEMNTIKNNITNPFKSVLHEFPETIIQCDSIAENIGVFQRMDGEEEPRNIGYLAALSTFKNVRGMDFSDVDIIFYDEFIPEKHARPIKEEYDVFLNMYETINRNRELQGQKPVKLVCAANSNDIANPIFIGLEIVERIGRMMNRKIESWSDPVRALSVYMFMKSPISEQKAETALYQLTAGSGFQDMALRNMFDLDESAISSRELKEYKPLARIGELVLYQHKSRDEYYIRCGKSGTVPDVYSTSDIDAKRFIKKYGYIFIAYLRDMVRFETSTARILFERYFA